MEQCVNTSDFQAAKLAFVDAMGLSKDALHIYVGLSVFLAAMFAFRRNPRSAAPIVFVLGLAALGEIFDARDDFRSVGHWRWRASVHDVFNTLFWPAFLWTMLKAGLISTRVRRH